MTLTKRIKELVNRSDRLYVLARCLWSANDTRLQKLIRGYYEKDDEADVILVEHYGQKLPDTFVYNITSGETARSVGLGAELHHLLYKLKFAESINAVPRVFWGNKMLYYDKQMDAKTKNVFEYYFDPVSDLSNYPENEFKNLIYARNQHLRMYQDMYTGSYRISEKHLEMLAEQYKKSIHLNDRTRDFIAKGLKEIVSGQKTLGVHVRGTDFNLGLGNHPVVISPEEYLEKVRSVFASGMYEKIFLATDDKNAIALFEKEFSGRLVYYTDTFRSENDIGPHSTLNERPLHHYLLGLEVLRDIYTLANCDGLVCGLSHVSFAARYVNMSLDRKFEKLEVLDKGINSEDSRKVREYRRREIWMKRFAWGGQNVLIPDLEIGLSTA